MDNLTSWEVDANASLPPFFFKNTSEHNILQLLLFIAVSLLISTIIVCYDFQVSSEYISTIIISLSLSYISGYIFYYLTILKQKTTTEKHILSSATLLLVIVEYIIEHIKLHKGNKINFNVLKICCGIISESINDIKPRAIDYYHFYSLLNYLQRLMVVCDDLIKNNNESVIDLLNKNLNLVLNSLRSFKDGNEVIDKIRKNAQNNPIYLGTIDYISKIA